VKIRGSGSFSRLVVLITAVGPQGVGVKETLR
jgi:hypothetical protein